MIEAPDIRSEAGIKPYKKFWSRVVYSAIFDWLKFKGSDSEEEIKLSDEAKNWLLEDKEVANPMPLTFQWVCEIQGWEYRTRQKALKKYGEQVDYDDLFEF